jgi:hypothetical protein
MNALLKNRLDKLALAQASELPDLNVGMIKGDGVFCFHSSLILSLARPIRRLRRCPIQRKDTPAPVFVWAD